jgi:hypothetical protein
MKRLKFIKYLNSHDVGFIKHRARHDKFMNHSNGFKAYIPRHNDIDEDLCDLICKQPGIPKPTANKN